MLNSQIFAWFAPLREKEISINWVMKDAGMDCQNNRTKLIFQDKVILENMKYAASFLGRAKGLMLASKKKVKNGICIALPVNTDTRFKASVTMLFCMIHPILFA
jgi:hypothetical protein